MSRGAAGEARRTAVFAVAVALAAGVAPPARAHIVAGLRSIALLTRSSELVVRARIVDGAAPLPGAPAGLRGEVVVAEVVETWKGEPPEGRLRFAQHGHGVPLYSAGEEVVVFLRPIEESLELAPTPLAGAVRFYSAQEGNAKFPLDDANREAYRRAVRGYAALEALESPEARREGLRALTFELLASPDAVLSSGALGDLALAGDALALGPADVPTLEALVASPSVRIGVRIGVLAELERRGLVDAPPRWVALLRGARGAERLAVVRAAAAHPSPELSGALVPLLASQEVELASVAAVSLGAPGNDAAVEALSRALESRAWRLRMSAVRGLGGIASEAARAALAEAARSHPDADTRRRAQAELETLARRAARSAAGAARNAASGDARPGAASSPGSGS